MAQSYHNNSMRQGYQNVVNVVNEESPSENNRNSGFMSNPISNLGGNLTEEQLQYSSYYNTYFNEHKNRNRSIAYGVIGIFCFIAFANAISSPKKQNIPSIADPSFIVADPLPNAEDPLPSVEDPIPSITDPSPSVASEDSSQQRLFDSDTFETQSENQSLSESVYYRFKQKTKNTRNNVQPGCEATILIVPACEYESLSPSKLLHHHCNYVGFERARHLSLLFGKNIISPDRRWKRMMKSESRNAQEANNEEHRSTEQLFETMLVAEEATAYYLSQLPVKWPIPSFLYALSPNNRLSSSPGLYEYREVETLTPLAKKIGVTINSKYADTLLDMDGLATELFDELSSGNMCGKIAVIAWSHEYIPDLAQQLGCGPKLGCPLQYDSNSYDDVWSIKYVYSPDKLGDLIYDEAHVEADESLFTGWDLFGTPVRQEFDPLRLSALVDDYDSEGVDVGGNWINLPEH